MSMPPPLALSPAGGPVRASLDARGVASLDLSRPEVGNAYDGAMIEALQAAVDALAAKPELRVVRLRGLGRHFQAGADLAWVQKVAMDSPQENIRISRATAHAVAGLNRLAAPTVALVQGACYGGGTGLIAACDIVVAAEDAQFSIAEVRWGLTAAIILPELGAAIGERALRRYALTGERFGAAEAKRIGLVHVVVPATDLAATGEAVIAELLASAPLAVAETKALLLEPASTERAARREALVVRHAARRQSAEAREGLSAFAQRRAPGWRP